MKHEKLFIYYFALSFPNTVSWNKFEILLLASVIFGSVPSWFVLLFFSLFDLAISLSILLDILEINVRNQPQVE